MSKFEIKHNSTGLKTIEAEGVQFVDDFVVFGNNEELVFACPKAGLYYIERMD